MKKFILILIFVAIALSWINQPLNRKTIEKPIKQNLLKAEIQRNILDKIDYYAKKHNLNKIIFQELIRKESRFNTLAIGDQGASLGLGQIQAKYWQDFCLLTRQELLDIDLNLNCSAKILKHYLKLSNNNYKLALARYNGGFSNSNRSKKYAFSILTNAKKLERYS